VGRVASSLPPAAFSTWGRAYFNELKAPSPGLGSRECSFLRGWVALGLGRSRDRPPAGSFILRRTRNHYASDRGAGVAVSRAYLRAVLYGTRIIRHLGRFRDEPPMSNDVPPTSSFEGTRPGEIRPAPVPHRRYGTRRDPRDHGSGGSCPAESAEMAAPGTAPSPSRRLERERDPEAQQQGLLGPVHVKLSRA